MRPARPSAPGVPRLLGGLTLLLLCPPAARGDCSLPPDVPNAQPTLGGHTSFPEQSTVTYKCNKGFVKIPGKADSAVCLSDNKWSPVAEFCNRSCDVPTRLLFASLKKPYSEQNYFPEGSTVEYECRMGYKRDPSLSGKLTCLANFTWSKADEFCKKKSCPNPGEIKDGHVRITTDILFGASIFFSCNTGYRLVGASSSFCSVVGNTVGWTDPLPECKEISCPEPPEIDNGVIQEPQNIYIYRHSITYKCAKGFTLIGDKSISCTVKDDQGVWSGPPPECKGSSFISKVTPAVQKTTIVSAAPTKSPPTPQKLTTVNVPGTEAPSTLQKPTAINSSATNTPLTPQKPITVNVSAAETPSTPHKPTSINSSATKVPLTPQKLTTVNVSAAETPSAPHKPTSINSSATKVPLTPQKPITVNVLATETPSAPHKPTSINSSATKVPLTPQKLTTVNVPAAEIPSAPHKPTTINSSATKLPLIPQEPTTINVPATETPSAPHKPTSINSSATKVPLTPQKPITVNVLATETPSTPHKPTSINSSATKLPLIPQKPTTVNVLATETPSAPHKPTSINSSATKLPLIPQKPTAVIVPAAETPSAPQKPTTANGSSTTAKKSPISNTVSTETPQASQNPIKANSSATQATRTTQRVTTAKASFTQSLPGTQKSTAVHVPVTKRLHTTQRLTSAHIAATQRPAVSRTTTRFHATSTSKGRGTAPSGATIITFGKFGPPAVKRNCHHCGMYNPYSWKRILSFNCLRNAIKVRCLWGPKRKQVNAFYRRVLWTPLGTRYVSKYSQPCSCSKIILGQLQIIWPINQVLLSAYCVNASF
ncbi:complement decay-accelerating factor isoform X1 [Manis pentadactyla]|uniref:complement decay-accelerating factor isoform X1 n=1 Tax=Manis pentadactyla TaxID=143292 RepID=UPI00255C3EBF|nr:complement decay-accelerating factor isoform X1 [Manis pentadactyla]